MELDHRITFFLYSGDIAYGAILADIAQLTIYVIPVILLAMLFLPKYRLTGLKIGTVALFSWIIFSQLIGTIIFERYGFRLRPFADRGFTELFFEQPMKAFPSDHAAVFAAVTICLFVYHYRKLGWAVLAISLIGSLARVMVGFHWAGDIVGGWLIGAFSFLLFWSVDELFTSVGKKLLQFVRLAPRDLVGQDGSS